METKALSRRPLASWMARAINSFPVPLSPVIITVLVVGAMVRTISRMEVMGLLWPMML